LSHSILKHSFSAKWVTPPSIFYIADTAFCRTLFNDPVGTDVDTTLAGFVIQNNVSSVTEQSINISSFELSLMPDIFKNIIDKLIEVNQNSGFNPIAFESFALGADIELNDMLDSEAASIWLTKKFIAQNLYFPEELSELREIYTTDISFILQNTKASKQYVYKIQPRNNKPTSLFFSVMEINLKNQEVMARNIIQIFNEAISVIIFQINNLFFYEQTK